MNEEVKVITTLLMSLLYGICLLAYLNNKRTFKQTLVYITIITACFFIFRALMEII